MNAELQIACDKFRDRWGADNPNLDEEVHAAYDKWLADMAIRPGNMLIPFGYDPEKYPEQSIYYPKIDAHDPYPQWMPDALYYAGVDLKMVRSLGALAYLKMLDQLRNQPVSSDDKTLLVDRLVDNQNGEDKRNTLVVTSHITFHELGYFKAMRMLAKHDRHNIANNGVLLNKIMTRQTYMGKSLVDTFKPASNIYFSMPVSASAEKFGVPDVATKIGNALFLKALKPDLKAGGLELDAALTGKQIIPIYKDDGIDHYVIPNVNESSADLLKGFDDIFGTTILKSGGKWKMGIGQLYDVREMLKTYSPAEIVDMVYAGVRNDVEQFTGIEVVYNPLATKIGKIASSGLLIP